MTTDLRKQDMTTDLQKQDAMSTPTLVPHPDAPAGHKPRRGVSGPASSIPVSCSSRCPTPSASSIRG